jgi:hypothetical protein
VTSVSRRRGATTTPWLPPSTMSPGRTCTTPRAIGAAGTR